MSKNHIYYQKILSKPRLGRFITATNGNHYKAIRLYKINLHLSLTLFGIISIVEIALRNAIDEHYKKTLGQPEWLKINAQPSGLFYHTQLRNKKGNFEQAEKIIFTINSLKNHYTHDKLVTELSFGFWRYLFSGIQFQVFGNTLLQIFTKRPKGVNQKTIFQKLININNIRNRIAHHEPICFSSQNLPSINYSESHYTDMIDILEWLGFNTKEILWGIEKPLKDWKKIQNL